MATAAVATGGGGGVWHVNAVLDCPSQSALIATKPTATFGDLKALVAHALGLVGADSKASKPSTASGGGGGGGSAGSAAATATATATSNAAPGGISTDSTATPAAAAELLVGYQLLAVSYHAAHPTDLTRTPDTAALKAVAGLTHLSTLLLIAPAALKPTKLRRRKDAAAANDDKAGGKEAVGKYDGLTAKNVLAKWAKASGKAKAHAFEYIEMFGSAVLQQRKAFAQLTREQVLEIVKSDALNVEHECEVFDAVIAWANVQPKPKADGDSNTAAALSTDSKTAAAAAAAEPGAAALRAVLGEVLYAVRVTQFALTDVALRVEPTKVLSQDQLLGLFTYLGQKAALAKDKQNDAHQLLSAPDALKAFAVRRPRVGRAAPFGAWDTANHSAELEVTGKGNATVVKRDGLGDGYAYAMGAHALPSTGSGGGGTHRWTVRIEHVTNWVFLGIGARDFCGFKHPSAWGWASYNQTFRGGTIVSGGTDTATFAAGAAVHFVFDAGARTLTMTEVPAGVTTGVAGRPSFTLKDLPPGTTYYLVADLYTAGTRLTIA